MTGLVAGLERDSLIPNCLLPFIGRAAGRIAEADLADGGGLGEGECGGLAARDIGGGGGRVQP